MMLSVTTTEEKEGINEEDDEENQVDDAQPTTPLRKKSLTRRSGTCSNSPSFSPINGNGPTEEFNPSNNNNKSLRFSEISSSTDSSTSDEGETLTGENEVPIIVPSSKFATPIKKLPFFHRLSRKRKKRKKKKLWQRISELPWGSNIEAFLVVGAAFTANLLIIGFIASLSIYYVEFKHAFPANHGLVSLSVFLPTGVFGSVGLLSGIFLNKFGVRITALTGSLLLVIGVGTCCFASNVFFLLPFLGAMAGTGCSLVYLSLTLGLWTYFQDKGRLLMPLVTMGEAFGTIIFPPLTSYFIDVYFWRGSLLMMSGVMLQVTVCSMMYSVKNLHPQKSKSSHKKHKSQLPSGDKNGSTQLSDALSNSSIPTQNTTVPLNHDLTPEEQPRKPSVEELNVSSLVIANSKMADKNPVEEYSKISIDGSLSKESQELQTQDIIPENMPEENSHLAPTRNSESEANTNLDSNLKTVGPKIRQRDTFLSILTNKRYMLFLIAVFVASGCINTMLTVLPDFCVTQGLSLTESANIYAIGASGDAIARIIGSWLLFRNQLSSLVIFTVSGIISGLLTAIYPFLSTFYLICLLSFFVMLHSGLLFSVYATVVLDFFDMNRYSIAMGLAETMAGFGVVLFGYIIGLITEYNNGSYVISFYLISSMSVASMLPMLILCLCKRDKDSVKRSLSNAGCVEDS